MFFQEIFALSPYALISSAKLSLPFNNSDLHSCSGSARKLLQLSSVDPTSIKDLANMAQIIIRWIMNDKQHGGRAATMIAIYNTIWVVSALMQLFLISMSSSSLILQAAAAAAKSYQPGLQLRFYAETCPEVEKVVEERIAYWSGLDETTPAPVLRLFFHDCFVQGCDASVLINSTSTSEAEKDAAINFSIGNFFVLDDIKARLEKVCPDTVSCADIIALAAVYSIKQAGGPLYKIELGRRDSLTSYAQSSQTFLPAFNLTVDGLLENFQQVGLNMVDLVALSGAHTIGQGHCASISNRIYPNIDKTYHKGYGAELLANCTDNGVLKPPNFDSNVQFFNDQLSSLIFDNAYFKGLQQGYGAFTSDISLLLDHRTKPLVDKFAKDQKAFFKQFGKSLRKMGKIGVLTGTQGQIRKQCWVRNSHNADFAFNPPY